MERDRVRDEVIEILANKLHRLPPDLEKVDASAG